MFSLNNQLELRKVIVSSLITCIYFPSIITLISYKGLLYSVGKGSSFYILVLIFIAELMKSFYLRNNFQPKKNKGSKSRVGDVAKASAFFLGVVFCFFVAIILFGAPVLDRHEETLMFSTLLALLTVFPLIAHAGMEYSMQLLFGIRNFSKDTILEMLVNNALFTIVGALLGAVVIPLDWNTPWQQWPIPCYLGAMGGYLLSNVLTVLKVTLMSAANNYPVLNVFINVLNKVNNVLSM